MVLEHGFGGAKCQRWQSCPVEPLGQVRIVPRRHVAGEYLALVDNDKVRTAWMFAARNDVQHARRPHGQAGFLEALAFGGTSGILSAVHETGRQRPGSSERLVDAPDEQHLIAALQQDGRRDLGIIKEQPAAIRADRPFAAEFVTLDQSSATPRTELDVSGIQLSRPPEVGWLS